MNWIVAGLITGAVAYVVDFVMWSKVFTKGMDQYVTSPPPGQQIAMGPRLAKAAALALVFGVIFAGLYVHFKSSLWATGILGGMEFGTMLWLPTIGLEAIGSGVWFDRVRTLLWAQFWSWLVRMNVAGIVVALLIK
ncbi:MAG: hypothetical protein ACREMM_00420 [Gemmatimonadales bacterium]